MADFDDDEEDNKISEGMNNLNELGLIRDSNNNSNDFNLKINDSGNNKANINNRTVLNNSLNIHNKIAHDLADDSQEEIDENNDAEPEELAPREDDDMNKSLDDLWAVHIYGKRDPNEKYVPFESKKAKFFERILHPMQYGSLRGSIFGLSSMCLEAGAMLLAIRCQQFGMVNFLIFYYIV